MDPTLKLKLNPTPSIIIPLLLHLLLLLAEVDLTESQSRKGESSLMKTGMTLLPGQTLLGSLTSSPGLFQASFTNSIFLTSFGYSLHRSSSPTQTETWLGCIDTQAFAAPLEGGNVKKSDSKRMGLLLINKCDDNVQVKIADKGEGKTQGLFRDSFEISR